jgi:hypothetical protein
VLAQNRANPGIRLRSLADDQVQAADAKIQLRHSYRNIYDNKIAHLFAIPRDSLSRRQ